MNGITEFLKALGVARLAAMGAVAAGLIGFFVYLTMQMSKQPMEVLYTNLQFQDSIAIIRKLEGLNVPHQVKQDGAIILVPKKEALKLRMRLAEEGLPLGGGVGYEIFDNKNNIGVTNTVLNINRKRAIEGELARTITSLDRVALARVHLNLPEKKLFVRKQAEPTASIVIRTQGALETGHIKAIQHLVASAIDGLKPSKVSIIDEKGKLLASGSGEEGTVLTGVAEEINRKYELRMQREIQEIVESVVGIGRVRVIVTADRDYNRVTQVSETYDPDGQVVRSTKVLTEAQSSSQPSGNGGVTVGNELPSAGGNNKGKTQKENQQKQEEVTNYEISKTNKTEITEAGRLKRLSIAVLVDGTYEKAPDGTMKYSPRPQQELDQIIRLVQSASGFDQGRGDKIHVANLKFAESKIKPLDEVDAGWGLSKGDYFYIAELVVTLLIALFVVLFIVRPLVRRILTPEETITLLEAQPAEDQIVLGEDGQPVLIEGGEAKLEEGEEEAALQLERKSNAIDLLQSAKMSGEVQQSFIKEVGELVLNNPQEAVTIIRSWMSSDSQDEAA